MQTKIAAKLNIYYILASWSHIDNYTITFWLYRQIAAIDPLCGELLSSFVAFVIRDDLT
jgi:hypothetical protein